MVLQVSSGFTLVELPEGVEPLEVHKAISKLLKLPLKLYEIDNSHSESHGGSSDLVISASGRRVVQIQQDAHEDLVTEYPKGMRRVLMLLGAVLPYLIVVLDDTVVAPILPILIKEFRSPRDIGWYASAYFLPLAVLMPLYGKAYTLWKLRPVFGFSLVLLTVGSVMSAAAKSSPSFIAGRAIAGCGAAGILTGSMRIILVSVCRAKRSFLESIGALIMGVCSMAGPILGGSIADHIGWRWSFWINAPVAAFSIIVDLFVFPPENAKSPLFELPLLEKIKRLNPQGATLIIGSLVCFICGLQIASTSFSFTTDIGALLGVGALLLALFLFQERFTVFETSLLPGAMLRHRTVWACCLGLTFLFSTLINYVYFLSIFFQAVEGRSPQESALRLLPYILANMIAAVTTGILVTKVRYYNPFFIVGCILLVTGAILLLQIRPIMPWGTLLGYEVVLGFGIGFTILANVLPCQTLLAEKYHSLAHGMTFLSSMLGAAISTPVSSTIFNQVFRKTITPLEIPFMVKLAVLSDPTSIRKVTPVHLLPLIIEKAMQAIKDTFKFGLACSILGMVSFALVPWRPMLHLKLPDGATSFEEGQGQADMPSPVSRVISACGSVTGTDSQELFVGKEEK